MIFAELRREYHRRICADIIRTQKGYPNFADGSNKSSCKVAWGIVNRLNYPTSEENVDEQTAGGRFEKITKEYLEKSFSLLHHLRPGKWHYSTVKTAISGFDQYEHLSYIEAAIRKDRALSTVLGKDYIVKPDIIIARWPVSDDDINQIQPLVSETETVATLTPFRSANRSQSRLFLHASISCKWTIRSDRSQNTRTEALNLIRNRKGRTPHIVAVTAEPLPTRIAALALGTGDMDCIYHFALPELIDVLKEIENEDQLDQLTMLVEGRRLRDISDLPFDLAI